MEDKNRKNKFQELEKYKQVEKSINKKFKKQIWSRFVTAIKKYELIKENDKIAVCISGGKDSMLLAKCMQQLQKISDVKFELEFIVMDPGYSAINRQKIEDNSVLLNIPIKIFDTQIFEIVENIEETPCYLCARMRRGYLYRNALQLGCNKIALGHHFDDAIETVLMSMFYAAEIKTMMPKLKSTNFENMELIRPLYMVHEEDIISWKKYNELDFLQCACRFTEQLANNFHQTDSKRLETKNLIKDLKKINPNIDTNIFTSIHNINLETIIGYRIGDEKYSFLDNY